MKRRLLFNTLCLMLISCNDISSVSVPSVTTDVTNLNAQVDSEVAITLNWTAVTAISSPTYTIAYTTGTTAPADCTTGTIVSGISATSQQVTGLDFNQDYAFRVCADDSGTLTAGLDATATTDSVQRIFVTVDGYNGNLGGLTGADSTCQTLAGIYGLPGTWKAILSDSTENAVDRIVITKAIYNFRPAGSGGPQRIAASAADLWDGTIAVPVRYDGDQNINLVAVWTGTQADGTVEPGNTCSDWNNTAGQGYLGSSNIANDTWIYLAQQNCNNLNAIYCIDGQ